MGYLIDEVTFTKSGLDSNFRFRWDDASCGCICRNTKKCPNRRKYFDQETCSCLCKKRALSGGCSYNDGDFDKLTCSCYRKSRTMDHSKGNFDLKIRLVDCYTILLIHFISCVWVKFDCFILWVKLTLNNRQKVWWFYGWLFFNTECVLLSFYYCFCWLISFLTDQFLDWFTRW